MSATNSIKLAKEILQVTRLSPSELRRESAMILFQQHRLSFGKVRQLAEMDIIEFQHLLAARQIPIHYDIPDYEQDLAVLRELGRL